MRLKVFREAFTIFFIGIIGSLGAGFLLSGMSSTLVAVPGLALLLPGILGARGTIHGSLGSKLSSLMHLGVIDHFAWDNELIRQNAALTHKASLFISLVLAFIASGLAKVAGIPVNPFLLFFVSVVSGFLAGIILIILTNTIAFQAFRHGWDPDNVTAPLIATLGDFVTVPILFGVALVALRLPQAFLIAIFILASGYIIYETRGYFLTPRFFILLVSISFQVFAGFFLENSIAILLMTPGILIFLPALLAQGGNLSSFIASRLATQLHLGTLRPEFIIRGRVVNEMLIVALLSLFIFPFLGTTAFLLQEVLAIPHMSFFRIIQITLEAGFLTTLLVAIVLGFSVSIISWRLNLDPDDVTIPILSAVADLFGILFLLLVI
ncbi:MAG: magnesium transporter [Candidatus Portnoybacteria bacterium]|nr:magnesium transporter [Candidatus Portnoybacteria bacterium]